MFFSFDTRKHSFRSYGWYTITREVCLCGGEEGDVGRFWGSHMIFREKQSFLIDYSEELWEIECQLTARVGGEVDF